MRHVHHREERADLHARERLFHGFAGSRCHEGLAVLHEARRDRPEAAPRLDGPPAQQDPSFPLGYAARHPLGIGVVDGPAGIAHMPRQLIARRNPESDRAAALAAELHETVLDPAFDNRRANSAGAGHLPSIPACNFDAGDFQGQTLSGPAPMIRRKPATRAWQGEGAP